MTDSFELVDLESVAKEFAWTVFEKLGDSKLQKMCSRDQVSIVLCWNRVLFDQQPADYSDERRVQIPNSQALFVTKFVNTTSQPQSYSFQTSRTTTSVCEVTLEKGYSIGAEVNIKLSVPGSIFEANAGFKKELSLSRSRRQCTEVLLTWGVDSQVHVLAGHETRAEISISEVKMDNKFSIKTHVTGILSVEFLNKTDNNSFMKCMDMDVVRMIQHSLKSNRNVDVHDNMAVFTTEGSSLFRYGSEQTISLTEKDLAVNGHD